eukprot:6201168-Pleurochrysis_carterae.AAC.6
MGKWTGSYTDKSMPICQQQNWSGLDIPSKVVQHSQRIALGPVIAHEAGQAMCQAVYLWDGESKGLDRTCNRDNNAPRRPENTAASLISSRMFRRVCRDRPECCVRICTNRAEMNTRVKEVKGNPQAQDQQLALFARALVELRRYFVLSRKPHREQTACSSSKVRVPPRATLSPRDRTRATKNRVSSLSRDSPGRMKSVYCASQRCGQDRRGSQPAGARQA